MPKKGSAKAKPAPAPARAPILKPKDKNKAKRTVGKAIPRQLKQTKRPVK